MAESLSNDELIARFSKGAARATAGHDSLADDDLIAAFTKPQPAPPAPPAPPAVGVGIGSVDEFGRLTPGVPVAGNSGISLAPLRAQFSGPVAEEPQGFVYGDIIPMGSGPNGEVGPTVPNLLLAPLRAFARQTQQPFGSSDRPLGNVDDGIIAAGGMMPGPMRVGPRVNRLVPEPAPPAIADRVEPTLAISGRPVAPEMVGPPAPANPLLGGAPAEVAAPAAGNSLLPPQPAEAAPAAAAAAPAPNSVGAAATTASSATLSPQEVARYQASAEGRKLLEPQPVGIPDNRQYVPGVSASTAEIEQTVNAAREAKAANIAHPEVSQADREMAEANSEHRKNFFEDLSGDNVSIGLLKDARKAQLERDYPAAFADAGPVDPAPVATHIRELLDQPINRHNDELRKYVAPLLDRLENPDGTPKIVDAEELYSLRKNLDRKRSKASQAEDKNLTHVSAELGEIIGAVDKAIEAGAPGYRQYMDNYAEASRLIDEQQVLQDHRNGLFDSKGRMTYNGVQRMMRNIVDARAAEGINPYKSISDETMAELWNLRDDLRRSASAQELARTPGSDTAQNLLDVAKRAGIHGVRLGAHAVANSFSPVLGSMAVTGVENALTARAAAKARQRSIEQGLRNLNPNRLLPPQE